MIDKAYSLVGNQTAATGGRMFYAQAAGTGTSLPGTFHAATLAEVATAADLAEAASLEYGEWSGRQKQALLNRVAELLEGGAAEIVQRAQLETALPLPRLQGELARTCMQLRQYGQAAAEGLFAGVRWDQPDPARAPLPKPELRSSLIPIGPVAVFGASNFPLAYSVAGGDTASALAAGCPVIVKAHAAHPGTSWLVGDKIRQAVVELKGPAGVFSLLFDDGYEVGRELVKDPRIKAVGFTGSRRGGRALMDLAAARPEPIPVYAEMSSVNPVFIFPGALAERAEALAAGLQASVTLGVGQFCTNPGLVFLIGSGSEPARRFITKLSELMAATPPGIMLTPGICASYQQGVKKLASLPGVVCLGPQLDPGEKPRPAGQAMARLLVTAGENFLRTPAMQEEIFGPATLVVECATEEIALAAARSLEGQLTATIHAAAGELKPSSPWLKLLRTKAGRLVYNGFPTGVEVAHAMTHGGPYPATSDGRSTSVGTRAMERFLRPFTYQNFPAETLPPELQADNPLQWLRLRDGRYQI